MIRTQIYITEQQKGQLNALSERSGLKQSELIREALDLFLEQESRGRREQILRKTAGIWKERTDLPDFKDLRANRDRGGRR